MRSKVNHKHGHLHLIFGPMFSGKSSELQRTVRRYEISKKTCLMVNYALDSRYSSEDLGNIFDAQFWCEDVVSTHDKVMRKAKKVQTLAELGTSPSEYDVIAVDEGQFFSDIVEFCQLWSDRGKIIIVAALDATYERKPFGKILELVAFAETVQKLSAVCLSCQNEAHFTYKYSNKTGEINDIGGIDKYIPVCRGCFISQSTEINDQKSDKLVQTPAAAEGKESKSGQNSTKEHSPSSPSRSDDEEPIAVQSAAFSA